MSSRALILLDRDGVLNQDSPRYVRVPDDVRMIPGAAEAVARLTEAGHSVRVVTNQSGIARGLIEASDLEAIHDVITRAVEARGGRIDGIHVCPHHPEAGCVCRKPRTGLIEAARAAAGSENPAGAETILVGDRESDLEAARAAGCRAVLVRTGHGGDTERALVHPHAVGIFDDLAAFVAAFLGP